MSRTQHHLPVSPVSALFTVPPNILDEESTQSAVAVRENQNITLTCKADGFPSPKIMWRREDGQGITIDRRKKGKCELLFPFTSPKRQLRCAKTRPQMASFLACNSIIFQRGRDSDVRRRETRFHTFCHLTCKAASALII